MQTLLDLLSAGKYLPAVGLVLIAVVGAVRAGIGAYVPWLRTKAGGYVLGFGSAVLLYVGTSLQAGAGVSLGLFTSALAAGWVAAGGWEHVRDVLAVFRSKPTDSGDDDVTIPRATIVSLGAIAMLAMFIGCGGCGASKIDISKIPTIDCTILDKSALEIAKDGIEKVLAEHPGDWWAAAEAAAGYGAALGGCELADLVQHVLTKRGATADQYSASEALEKFRARFAGGAVFRTAKGDL